MIKKPKKTNDPLGQGWIEFIIITPVLFITVLGILQMLLFFSAHQGVKLAAYKAARSLIVNINNLPLEKALRSTEESAVLSLINFSPKIPDISSAISLSKKELKVLPNLTKISTTKGLNPMRLFQKYLYSKTFSHTKVIHPSDPNNIRRGQKVSIQVDFLYHLGIPVAGELLYKILSGSKSKTAYAPGEDTEFTRKIPESLFSTKLRLVKISKTATMQSEY